MEPIPSIIAIVRDAKTLETIRTTLAAQGIQVLEAGDAEEGWKLIHRGPVDAILVESTVAGRTGLLERIADWDPGAPILLLADGYSAESAVEGIQRGACGCLSKPLTADALRQWIAEVLDEARLRRETLALDDRLRQTYSFHGMVGRSPRMLELFARIRRVAPHYRIALISGATGTGKELVARALHEVSPVANRRFAVCNCPAIVETLFESELFGHIRGAFTGATQDRVGLFEYAQGGTVFLDEIADLPLATQSKLLRVVQSQEMQRVGSPEVRKVDVRIVAATNRDMRSLIAANLFREDLYYRLSMVELELPSLAERREDLPLLQRYFVEKFARSYGKRIGGISRRAQIMLSRHCWPGNVRELENAVAHGCMMAESDFVDVGDLPEYLHHENPAAAAGSSELIPLADVDHHYTQHVLERVGGNKVQAAQILGISRATLYRILRDGAREPRKAWPSALGRIGAPPRLRVQ